MRHTRLRFVGQKYWLAGALLCSGASWQAAAQAPAPPSPAQPAPDTTPDPHGQIIIESHGEPPAPGQAAPAIDPAGQPLGDPGARADVTDAQRSALLITSYDLDARLNLAQSGLSARARLIVRNEGTEPLKELALQISSTLHWDSATLVNGAARTHLPLAQHRLETDADHTGAETEAILPLAAPLAPGDSATLDLFYSGTVQQSASRLQRLGASAAQQSSTDWDSISPTWTGLRGFGEVLWYPVASPQLFFAEGNSLFEAIGRSRLDEEHSSVRLRLSVDYAGSPPAAAYFCGRRQALQSVADDPNGPTAAGTGIATATFTAEPLGFRTPSLFVVPLPETILASGQPPPPESSSSAGPAVPAQLAPQTPAPQNSDDPPFLAMETSDTGSGAGLSAAANHVVPLLREWLGPRPLSALTVLDHSGQPFQDGPLLVAPASVLEASPDSQALLQSLTHAWVQTGLPWMDEGLPQFFALLWTERESGHAAANTQLTELMQPVALVEPASFTDPKAPRGQPLIDATDEIYYRRKAAAVWWMLRGLVGDGTLHQALTAWRTQPASPAPAAEQAIAFERLLEHLSGKDLGWFFSDWVLRDRGLPDLSITNVSAAAEPAGNGHPGGWLVAVTVRNDGSAAAEVPIIIRSGNATPAEQLMRINGLASATQRILIETAPTSVQVNDGSIPEQREAQHAQNINLQVR